MTGTAGRRGGGEGRARRPLPYGEGTVYYDAGAGLWRASLLVGRKPDGRPDRRVVSARTEKACLERFRDLRQALAAGTLSKAHRLTVAEFFAQWLEAFVARRSVATHTQYESLLRRHLFPALGPKPLKALEAQHLQALYHALETSGRHEQYGRRRPAPGVKDAHGLAPKTIRNLHVAVHAGLERAVKLQLIPRNPADLVDLPRAPRRRRLRLGIAEVHRFLAAAASAKRDRRRHLWTFLLNTGLRVSEALALRWELVDLQAKCFYVEENLERDAEGGAVAGDPKTDAGYRPVPLTDAALAALGAQRRQQERDRARLVEGYDDRGLVFATALGTPDRRDNVRRAIKLVAGRADLPDAEAFTTHDLRRLCASLLRASGVTVEVAMAILGHRNAAMLLEVYASALSEEAARAAVQLQRYLYGGQERPVDP